MNKRTVLIVLLLLFLAGVTAVYWFKFGFTNLALRETLYLLAPFFAIVGGFFALRTFGLTGSRSVSLFLLIGGICYWFFGELLFNYYEYILFIDPYPSAADFFYMLAYPLLFFGLVNEIRFARVNWHNIPKPTLFLFCLVALFLTAIIGYFGIYRAYVPDEAFMTNAVAIGYGVGDVFLLLANSLLLLLVREFRGGKLSRVWLLLFFGFLSTLVADILFALYRNEYEALVWFYKSLLDTFWIAGYLFFALAFFEFGFSIQDAYKKAVFNASNKGLEMQPAAVNTEEKVIQQ